ncbi:MAG TPA: transcription-repair coupling factor [Bryobacteraceae bacterium]|nr:transcription-repair coupling factor [Bryobacteraceae bacterium]
MTHPAVRDLFQALTRNPAFQELVREILRRERRRISLSGLTTTAKAAYLTLLWQATERPLIILAAGNKQAEALSELIETFFDLLVERPDLPRPQFIPALDVLPHQRLSPHSEITEQRAIGLWRLAVQNVPLTVAPVASALLRTEPPEFYRQLALTLRVGEELPLDDVMAHLESIGYERREPVEMVGEYSVRGGILDVFSAESSRPVRVEFFGDEVESIRRFDIETQRSVVKVAETVILPLVEYPRSRPLFHELAARIHFEGVASPGDAFPGWEFVAPMVRPRTHSLLSFSPDAIVVLDEPEPIAASAERMWKRLEDPERPSPISAEANYFRWGELQAQAADRFELHLRELELGAFSRESLHIATRPAMSFHGSMQVAVAEAKTLVEQGYRVAFLAPSLGELERLADIFQEYSIPFQLGVDPDGSRTTLTERAYLAGSVASTYLIRGAVRKGAVFPDARLALFGAEDLFDASDLIARPSLTKGQLAAFAADIADLKPGDYVVHATHGIGRFVGLREIAQGDQKGDFMLLEYAGDSKLYVPLTRLDLVQKYRGAGDVKPQLDKLGGATWNRTKSRVKAKMRDMAEELLKLYAQRRLAEGFAFSPDSNWQREFEDAFEFAPTKDQLTAVQQIKRDMESPHPMDRLLCGDVGYGKTEVAMRAAFKALGDGKQVAVLAPTTVLAFQHFETFKRRFAPFPVRVELLSRFRSPKEVKAVIEDIAQGKVDIAIGTHRLLSKDVEFRDLGLLVIDEEQRFGVRHKERLKQLKQNIDVLTMSATPIPRTLHMSMLGIRDMSVIETPPKDRLAIHTVVAHFDPELIRAAIEQELGRGGQAYYIHNRVETIFERAAMIRELLPECRIGVGHGQMGEAELERVLLGFMRHEFDVFVSTTIVENGLDIPLANTIIIENAERYGLSELYQLRGRVGRSNRRAYAYLLTPADTELSEIARKRLAALKEFSDLGAGFKIAALDLELRGAGNILGGEQHGHIEAVGFDMYVRMLEETVQELRGEKPPVEIQSSLNLGLDIRIPAEYISDEHQRLRAYKRIADVSTPEEAEKVLAELSDRYGPAPDAVRSLLDFSLLKSAAQRLGIEAVDRRGGALNLKFHETARIDPSRLMNLVRETKGAQFTPAGVLRLPVDGAGNAAALLAYLKEQLSQLSAP